MNLREIDRLVLEKVFGYKVGNNHFSDEVPKSAVPNYTTDLSKAWQAVEEVGYEQVQIKDMGKFGKRVYIEGKRNWPKKDSNAVIAYAETVPVALCLAVLKAHGIELEGEE
jgi:hypothetical protein